MGKEEKRIVALDQYEHGVVINALNDMRNDLIEDDRPTDIVDEILLKTIDAPTKKVRCKHNEARKPQNDSHTLDCRYSTRSVDRSAYSSADG